MNESLLIFCINLTNHSSCLSEVFPFVMQPIIGHGSSETSPFQHAKEAGLYYVEDPDVNLASLAGSKIVPDHLGQITVKGK